MSAPLMVVALDEQPASVSEDDGAVGFEEDEFFVSAESGTGAQLVPDAMDEGLAVKQTKQATAEDMQSKSAKKRKRKKAAKERAANKRPKAGAD